MPSSSSSSAPPSSSFAPPRTPLPIQYTPLRKEDFASDSGVSFINQYLSQLTTTVNAFVGAGGPTILPAGADLQGSVLSGLGTPSSSSDAVPLGHATSAFGPATQQQQLDIGKPYALKGLTGLWSQVSTLQQKFPAQFSGTVPYVTLYGITFQWGHVASISTSGTSVTFTAQSGIAFPNACLVVLLTDDDASGSNHIMSVVKGTLTTTGFQAKADGSGNGTYYLAIGW